jgi:hypothetical protein
LAAAGKVALFIWYVNASVAGVTVGPDWAIAAAP